MNNYLHGPEDPLFSTYFRDAMIYMHVVLISVGIMGTLCVLVVFSSDRSLWKPSYFFVGFLAMIDTLHLAVVGSFKIQFLQHDYSWKSAQGGRCWWVAFATLHLMLSTTLSTVIIAFNRFVRVFYSNAQYHKVFRVHLVALMCLGVIVLAGLWSVCAHVGFHPNIPVCFLDAKQSKIRVSLLLGQYALSYSVVVFLYGSIIKKLVTLDRKLKPAVCSRISPTVVVTRNSTRFSQNSNQKIQPPYSLPTQFNKEGNRVADKESASLGQAGSQSSANPFSSMECSGRRDGSFDRPQQYESAIWETTDNRHRTCNIESRTSNIESTRETFLDDRKTKGVPSITFAKDEPHAHSKTFHRSPVESSGIQSSHDSQLCSFKRQSKTSTLPPQEKPKVPSSSSSSPVRSHSSLLHGQSIWKHMAVRLNVFSKKPREKRSVDNLKFGFVFYILNIMTCIPFWVFFVVEEWYQLELPRELMPLSHFLILCGSAFNSLVYGMMNKSFRKSGQRLWHKLLRKTRKKQNDIHPAKMADYSDVVAC